MWSVASGTRWVIATTLLHGCASGQVRYWTEESSLKEDVAYGNNTDGAVDPGINSSVSRRPTARVELTPATARPDDEPRGRRLTRNTPITQLSRIAGLELTPEEIQVRVAHWVQDLSIPSPSLGMSPRRDSSFFTRATSTLICAVAQGSP